MLQVRAMADRAVGWAAATSLSLRNAEQPGTRENSRPKHLDDLTKAKIRQHRAEGMPVKEIAKKLNVPDEECIWNYLKKNKIHPQQKLALWPLQDTMGPVLLPPLPETFTVGRKTTCQLVIAEAYAFVSGEHCRLQQ